MEARLFASQTLRTKVSRDGIPLHGDETAEDDSKEGSSL